MTKQEEFINWLTDKSDDFPFFQDIEDVDLPETQYNRDSVADFDVSPDGIMNRA